MRRGPSFCLSGTVLQAAFLPIQAKLVDTDPARGTGTLQRPLWPRKRTDFQSCVNAGTFPDRFKISSSSTFLEALRLRGPQRFLAIILELATSGMAAKITTPIEGDARLT